MKALTPQPIEEHLIDDSDLLIGIVLRHPLELRGALCVHVALHFVVLDAPIRVSDPKIRGQNLVPRFTGNSKVSFSYDHSLMVACSRGYLR